MVAAPMLFTTATASSTTKMTTRRDAIVECKVLDVEEKTIKRRPMSPGPCYQKVGAWP